MTYSGCSARVTDLVLGGVTLLGCFGSTPSSRSTGTCSNPSSMSFCVVVSVECNEVFNPSSTLTQTSGHVVGVASIDRTNRLTRFNETGYVYRRYTVICVAERDTS